MSLALSPPTTTLIPPGTPWRSALRRPVFGSLLLAAAFVIYTAPVKETPGLFDHAPWTNDPFDTVISFMMFFVPMIAVFCVPRMMLCRRSQALPAARIRDLLRGCRVVVAGVSLTLVTEWIAVAIRDNRAEWNAATWLQIGLLAVMTLAALAVARELRRVGLPRRADGPNSGTADWLADAFALAEQWSRLLAPARAPVVALLSWADHRVVAAIRRHPVWTAAAGCAVFGAGAGINQGIRESYDVSVTAVVCVLLAAGMFGLLVAAGSYLGLVDSEAHLQGTRRRLIIASVITCILILVPFAMRNHLWWAIGSSNSAAGLTQLLQLLGLFAASIFVAGYGVATARDQLRSASR